MICRKQPGRAAALRRDAPRLFPLNFAPQPTRTDPHTSWAAPPGPHASPYSQMQGAPVLPPAARPPSLPLLRIAPLLTHEHHRHGTTRPSAAAAGRTDGAAAAPALGRAPPPWSRGARSRGRSVQKALLKTVPPAPSGEAGCGAAVCSVTCAGRCLAGQKRSLMLYAWAAERCPCTQRRLETLVGGLCHPHDACHASRSRPSGGFSGCEPGPPFRGLEGFSVLFLFSTAPGWLVRSEKGQSWHRSSK